MTGVLLGKGVVATVAVSDRMLYYEAGNFSTGDEYCKSGSSRSTIFQKKWHLYGNPCRMRGTGTCITENPKLRPEELKLKLYESARKETGMSMAWGVLDVDNLLALV